MKLRNELEELGRMKGANKDEKGESYDLHVIIIWLSCDIDPEEFLNLLFKEILHVEPFISIKWEIILLLFLILNIC